MWDLRWFGDGKRNSEAKGQDGLKSLLGLSYVLTGKTGLHPTHRNGVLFSENSSKNGIQGRVSIQGLCPLQNLVM